jgi:hypothetical protein
VATCDHCPDQLAAHLIAFQHGPHTQGEPRCGKKAKGVSYLGVCSLALRAVF